MSVNKEFQRYLKAAAINKSDNPHVGHPSEGDLIASREGRLSLSEHEKIQSHLSTCPECLQIYRDLADFFHPVREGEPGLGEAQVRQAWNTFRQRLQRENAGGVHTSPSREAKDIRAKKSSVSSNIVRFLACPLPVRVVLPLAATLLLVLGLTGTWALWLNREKQELAARLASETQTAARLEEESRRWQAQTEDLKKEYESQLAAAKEPQLNAPVYDVFPTGNVQRSGSTDLNQLVLQTNTKEFTLILNGEGVPKHAQYSVRILGEGDQVLWQGKGLQPDRFGSFFMRLPTSLLSNGRYRLRLYGVDAGNPPVAEYRIAIRFASR